MILFISRVRFGGGGEEPIEVWSGFAMCLVAIEVKYMVHSISFQTFLYRHLKLS